MNARPLMSKQSSPVAAEISMGMPNVIPNTATPRFFSPGVLACSQREETSKAMYNSTDRPSRNTPASENDFWMLFFT